MRTRWSVKCERCKIVMPLGSLAVRFHGRLWHLSCALDYMKARRERTLTLV